MLKRSITYGFIVKKLFSFDSHIKLYLYELIIFFVILGIISFVDPLQKRIIFSYTQNDFIEPVCAAVNPFYHGESLMLITGLSVPDYLQVEF